MRTSESNGFRIDERIFDHRSTQMPTDLKQAQPPLSAVAKSSHVKIKPVQTRNRPPVLKCICESNIHVFDSQRFLCHANERQAVLAIKLFCF